MRDCRFVFPSIIGDEDEGSEDEELVHGRENLSYFILNKDKGMNKITLLNKLIYKIPNKRDFLNYQMTNLKLLCR